MLLTFKQEALEGIRCIKFIRYKVHFRYRGYYYEEKTSRYYLQSWYYDPSICRFISADQYELVGTLSDVVGQLNLYAYCNNNPIMYTDPSGEIVLSTALIIIGAVAGVIAGGYIGYQAVVNDPTLTTSQKLASIGLCAILGGIAGGFFGAGLGYALPAMISGGIGSATEAALVGAVAISLEEAIIMGVAVGCVCSSTIAGSGDTKVESRYPNSREHGNPVHFHAANNGNPSKIGPNGKPLAGEPELKPAQKKVIEENLNLIKKEFKKVQRWIRKQPR